MPSKKPRISTERAQDWITSVINPILAGLRRELRFLPAGPWHWLHQRGDFEYLRPVKKYVAEIYIDNYDDFLLKHPHFKPLFDTHDEHLATLGAAIEKGFDVLATNAAFQESLRAAVEPRNVDEHGRQYFMAYLAGGYDKLSDVYADHDVYNSLPEGVLDMASALLEPYRESACEAGKRLERADKELVELLSRERTEIADRYGARVMPVDQ